MTGENLQEIDASRVLGHILTRDNITIAEVEVLQHALVDTDNASFSHDDANGNFGPGTTEAIVDYLSGNEHLVSRLGDEIKDNLIAQGVDNDFFNQAAVAADMPDDSNMKIEYLLGQAYDLSMGEVAALNRLLGGADENSHPDYLFGPEFRDNLKTYIDNNPSVDVQNVYILEKVMRDSERFGDHTAADFNEEAFRDDVFRNSKGFMQELNSLIERQTDDVSAVNYRIQTMLKLSGYDTSRPDGKIDSQNEAAIQEFKADFAEKSQSLTYSWKPEAGFAENAVIENDCEFNVAAPSLVS